MTFSSMFFLFRFLPIFLILYFIAPGRMKNIVLFLGSLFFCTWGSLRGTFFLLVATVLNYILGQALSHCVKRTARNVLFFFGVLCNLLLPTGLTIYTLQALSYLTDCYRKKELPQKNFMDFAVYFTLFAPLVAGLVVRYGQVKQQLRERKPDAMQISYGMKRFILGLAKNVLLANNLGFLWSEISAKSLGDMSVLTAWVGVLALTYQMYFFLSGYADMAIGLGAILGFTLPENFDYPYRSTSITNLAQRFSITMVEWFRDYVYEPLVGEKKKWFRTLPSILIVGLLLGLWLGRDISFVVFGLWFAFWIVLEKLGLKELLERSPKILGRIYTMFIVMIGWVFFTMESWSEVTGYLFAMFGVNGVALYDREGLFMASHSWILFLVALVAATPMYQQIKQRLESSVNGAGIAFYRFLEKLIPALLLLWSIAYCVDTPARLFY